MEFTVKQIGKVTNQISERKDVAWGNDLSEIIIDRSQDTGTT